MYEIVEPLHELGQVFIKKLNEDGTESYIPEDPNNTDYQAYLLWVKEGEVDVDN